MTIANVAKWAVLMKFTRGWLHLFGLVQISLAPPRGIRGALPAR